MYTYGFGLDDLPALAAQKPVAAREYTALNTIGTGSQVNGPLFGAFIPIKFSAQATVSELVLRAILAYSGTALSFRVGIYNDNNGVPGSLLIDAGTITWSSVTLGQAKSIACSQVLNAGVLYWVAVGCNLASGAPSMHATVGHNLPFADLGLAGELGGAGYYFNHNGANALPSTAPAVTFAAYNFPRVYVKLAP